MAWLLLQRQEPVHLHHVHLKTSTHRDVVESIAVSRIISWLKSNARPFDYTMSVARAIGYDIVVVSRQCAELCKRKGIRPAALARGSNAHDMARTSLNAPRELADKEWAKHWDGDPPPVIYPIANMTKAELWHALPEPLRNLTWSCRQPKFEDEVVRACGQCRTCQEMSGESVPLNLMHVS